MLKSKNINYPTVVNNAHGDTQIRNNIVAFHYISGSVEQNEEVIHT